MRAQDARKAEQMAWEHGKYEDELNAIHDRHAFAIGCLIVVGGGRGSSFDVLMKRLAWPTVADYVRNLRSFVQSLRMVADGFEEDANEAERTGKLPWHSGAGGSA